MAAYPLSRSLANLGQALRSYRWRKLSLVLIVAACVAYRALSLPAVVSSASQTLSANPAQQSVFDYLWAHRSNQPIPAPTATLNPAQQSVMNYLDAHERVDRSPTLWDQAALAVRNYLRVHSQ